MVLFQALLTLFALNIVSAIVQHSLKNTLTGSLASLIIGVAGVVVGVGLTVITFKIAKGEATTYADIAPKASLVFIATLLAGVLTAVGFILLIIPGIYFALRFAMVRYAVIEGAGVMESFEKSTKLTEGYKWPLLGFFAVVIILNIVGAILFFVGLLVTIPVTMIAMAQVYLKLKNHAGVASVAHEHTHEAQDHSDHTHSA